jgi:hypothetical protein
VVSGYKKLIPADDPGSHAYKPIKGDSSRGEKNICRVLRGQNFFKGGKENEKG